MDILLLAVLVIGLLGLGWYSAQQSQNHTKEEQHPSNDERLELLAQEAFQQQDYEKTIAYCNALVNHNPLYANAFWQRYKAYWELKEYAEALKDCQQVIELNPSFAYAYRACGEIYAALEQPERAIQAYTEALQRKIDDHGYTSLQRAKLYQAQARYPEAIADVSAALAVSIREDRDSLYFVRGCYSYDNRQYSDAIQDFSTAISQNPKRSLYFLSRGRAFKDNGNLQAAEQDFGQVLALEKGGTLEAHQHRAQALTFLKRYPESIEEWRHALTFATTRKEQITIYHALRTLYEAEARWTEVLATLEHLQTLIVPTQTWLLNGLAWYRLLTGGNINQALQEIEQALALEPETPHFIDTRAHIFFLQGDYARAVAEFEQATALTETDKQLPYLVGQAVTYFKMGQTDQAREIWHKLLQLDARYRSADALIEDFHPAEAFVAAYRELIEEFI